MLQRRDLLELSLHIDHWIHKLGLAKHCSKSELAKLHGL